MGILAGVIVRVRLRRHVCEASYHVENRRLASLQEHAEPGSGPPPLAIQSRRHAQFERMQTI